MNTPYALEQQYGRIAGELDSYIDSTGFWDPSGLMYAYIDVSTGRPFEPEFITNTKVPRRADVDPWAWWTYEDTVESTGVYIDGLIRKYRVTGDAACLDRARSAWESLRNIYYASQVYGIGSFLRPYGGFEGMGRFVEPLGTDQASPMFSGLYFYMRYADDQTRAEIADIMLKTLTWYEQQGFKYFYYKNFIHHWEPATQHAAAYYLPAIAWAAQVTGEDRWRNHLEAGLALFRQPDYTIYDSFCWGGDLAVLRDVFGDRIADYLTSEIKDKGFARCQEALSVFDEPGMTWRVHPESAEPGFQPYVRPDFNRNEGFGFAYLATVHGGRARPRRELHFLCGLAELGYPGAFERAVEVLGCRNNVPGDFMEFLSEDYDNLPETVHIYARSVGAILFEWWRDYWWLREIESRKTTGAGI